MQTASFPGWPNTNLDAIVQNKPVNFIRSGNYNPDSGNINGLNTSGYHWGLQAAFDNRIAMNFNLNSTFVRPQDYNFYRGNGFSIRCLIPLATIKK